MLQHLEIHNFAIIDQLHIDFEEGMTVLTVKQELVNPSLLMPLVN